MKPAPDVSCTGSGGGHSRLTRSDCGRVARCYSDVMANSENILDLTKDGVQFAEWRTIVQDVHLELRSVSYNADRSLVAVFTLMLDDREVVFKFKDTNAFRVLDEGALLEIWATSKETPRPARTTFKVRGHMWQGESVLAWIHGTPEPYWSHMIATDDECLEVVCEDEPKVCWA